MIYCKKTTGIVLLNILIITQKNDKENIIYVVNRHYNYNKGIKICAN